MARSHLTFDVVREIGLALPGGVHLVLDNLNTHLRESFEEVLGIRTAATILRRLQYASWLNMSEIEIGVLQRQCLARSQKRERPSTIRRACSNW